MIVIISVINITIIIMIMTMATITIKKKIITKLTTANLEAKSTYQNNMYVCTVSMFVCV